MLDSNISTRQTIKIKKSAHPKRNSQAETPPPLYMARLKTAREKATGSTEINFIRGTVTQKA